jgi:hypothetical protein
MIEGALRAIGKGNNRHVNLTTSGDPYERPHVVKIQPRDRANDLRKIGNEPISGKAF